jgi:hypothetical protein
MPMNGCEQGFGHPNHAVPSALLLYTQISRFVKDNFMKKYETIHE